MTTPCIQCGIDLPADVGFCTACGADQLAHGRTCNSCGAEVGVEDAFCGGCGLTLQPVVARATIRTAPRMGRTALLALVAVVALGAVAYGLSRGSEAPEDGVLTVGSEASQGGDLPNPDEVDPTSEDAPTSEDVRQAACASSGASSEPCEADDIEIVDTFKQTALGTEYLEVRVRFTTTANELCESTLEMQRGIEGWRIIGFLGRECSESDETTPDHVVPDLQAKGYYIEPGSAATERVLSDVVSDSRSDGGLLYLVVLSKEPPGGATTFSDSILDLLGSGYVLTVAPETVGFAGDGSFWSADEMNAAIDASLDGESDDEVLQQFVSALTDPTDIWDFYIIRDYQTDKDGWVQHTVNFYVEGSNDLAASLPNALDNPQLRDIGVLNFELFREDTGVIAVSESGNEYECAPDHGFLSGSAIQAWGQDPPNAVSHMTLFPGMRVSGVLHCVVPANQTGLRLLFNSGREYMLNQTVDRPTYPFASSPADVITLPHRVDVGQASFEIREAFLSSDDILRESPTSGGLACGRPDVAGSSWLVMFSIHAVNNGGENVQLPFEGIVLGDRGGSDATSDWSVIEPGNLSGRVNSFVPGTSGIFDVYTCVTETSEGYLWLSELANPVGFLPLSSRP